MPAATENRPKKPPLAAGEGATRHLAQISAIVSNGITTPGRTNSDRTTNVYHYDSSGTYLTEIDHASGQGVQITTTFPGIDPASGLVTNSIADTTNNVTTNTAYDDLGRPTLIREAAGDFHRAPHGPAVLSPEPPSGNAKR